METPNADCRQLLQHSKQSHAINCKRPFQASVQQFASIFFGAMLIAILMAIMIPTNVEAQSRAQPGKGKDLPSSDGSSLTDGLDPLAPGGVSVGMEFSEVAATLKAEGYVRSGVTCDWMLGKEGEGVWIKIRVHAVDPATGWSRCGSGGVIRDVHYDKTDYVESRFSEAPSPSGMIDFISSRLGPPDQKNCIPGKCRWVSPSSAPLVKYVLLNYSGSPLGKIIAPKPPGFGPSIGPSIRLSIELLGKKN